MADEIIFLDLGFCAGLVRRRHGKSIRQQVRHAKNKQEAV
jgi:hypothetical protein